MVAFCYLLFGLSALCFVALHVSGERRFGTAAVFFGAWATLNTHTLA